MCESMILGFQKSELRSSKNISVREVKSVFGGQDEHPLSIDLK